MGKRKKKIMTTIYETKKKKIVKMTHKNKESRFF